jgi:hypothetical protein
LEVEGQNTTCPVLVLGEVIGRRDSHVTKGSPRVGDRQAFWHWHPASQEKQRHPIPCSTYSTVLIPWREISERVFVSINYIRCF